MRREFEAWCAKDNPKYWPSDNGILNRRDWAVWQAATATRKPLTDEVIKNACGASDVYWAHSKLFILAIARAIEAAHDIKPEGGDA